ncbi:UNVERIFIED_CONTAM: hypothetical protein H355_011756 [Colinus virginianus]|nr:hypothetical protein H355_011756 [Colinus virginianus]
MYVPQVEQCNRSTVIGLNGERVQMLDVKALVEITGAGLQEWEMLVAFALRSRGRCCLKFLDKALPPNKVMMYEYTGSSCPYPGIIFTTFEDRTCCANPEEKWVQDLLNVEKHKDGSK